MNTINSYFENAQMSLAAYALSLRPTMSPGEYEDALVFAGMSDAQAARFASDYTIVDQYTDSATGLSATVFQKGTQYFLAIRGTEDALDLLADAQLLLGGAARAQIVSLYNYVQRLITPAGQSAIQVEDVAPDIDPITGYVNDPGGIRTTTSATGLGYLAGVSGMTVTGHSLGGHLAAAASYLFPTLIGTTDTYNAPGFNLNYAEALLDQFPGSATAFPTTITNLVAHAGADVIAAVGTLPGTPERIFIEDQGVGIPGNHGVIPLTDSLAIYNLLATLDPTLNNNPATGVPKITDILKASAGTPGKSLENTLDALRTLFQQNYANSTADSNAAPTFVNDRDNFYTQLYGLETYLKTTPFYNTITESFSFTVDKLTNRGVSSLVTDAQTDIATRYALYKLNPFVVNNAPALYNTINTDGSLDLYVSSTRTGSLTDEYLKDRASFLYNKIQANNQDHDITADASTLATTWVQYSGNPQYFEDNGNYLPYKLYLGPDSAIVNQPTSGLNQIKFGSVNNDPLTGGTLADKLYGLAGDDSLQGKKGNDYLEGGQGTDTYNYVSGDGTDTILDTDHLGKITYDGIDLNGGKLTETGDNTYRSDDSQFIYTLLSGIGTSDWLSITGPGGNIIIKDFASGDLGITLNAADPLPTLTEWPALDPDATLPADQRTAPNWDGLRNGTTYNDYTGSPDNVDLNGDGSNDIGSILGTNDAEIIHGLTGNDFIDGHGGADRLYGDEGSDTIYFYSPDPVGDALADGGSGRDAIVGWSDGHNHFIGGGNDDPQDEADLLISQGGNDYLQGGYGPDLLLDYLGADILDGGRGDDYLYGNASVGFVDATAWTVGPVLDVINGVQFVDNVYTFPAPQFTGLSSINFSPTSDNQGDVLLGGAGNDYLDAGPGDDLLDAGSIEDTSADTNVLFAGLGKDVLMGGAGRDWLMVDGKEDVLLKQAA